MKKTIIAATVAVVAMVGVSAADHHGKPGKHDHSKPTAQAEHSAHNHDHAALGKKAPEFTLSGIDGKDYSLASFKGKWVVLEWTNPDCPFVKRHYGSGNMQALQKKLGKKEVVWLTINSSAPGKQGYYEAGDLADRMKDEKHAGHAYLRDPDGKVGHLYAAATTPHMYVIDPEQTLIYAGAIDDAPRGSSDEVTNYVSASLESAMSGKPVKTPFTKPYGCSVKYAQK